MFTASAANDTGSRGILVMGRAGFTPDDIEDVERVRNVHRVAPTYKGRMKVRRPGEAELEALIIAQDGEPTAELSANATWPLEDGTLITETDGVGAKRVAVIGGPVRDRLFGADASVIGKYIVIQDESFMVTGVLDRHPPFVGADLPDAASIPLATRVYIPLRTGVEGPFAETRPTLLRVLVEAPEYVRETTADIRELLVGRYGPAIQVEPSAVSQRVSPSRQPR